MRQTPCFPLGHDVLEMVSGVEVIFGKKYINGELGERHNWEKKRIFFELPH